MWTDKAISQLIQKHSPGITKEQYKTNFKLQDIVQEELEKSYDAVANKYKQFANSNTVKALIHFLGQGDGELYLQTLLRTGSYDDAQKAVDQSILNRTKKPNPNKITIQEYLNRFNSNLS